jgi:guanylate kinase
VVQEVLKRLPNVHLSVSATTRPARPGERHGVDYYFVSPQDFARMREGGDLLEQAEVYGNLYGTPKAPVEEALRAGRDVILEIDIQGALNVKRALPRSILVFIEPPSIDALMTRLKRRGTEDAAALQERVRAAYEEVKAKGLYDHIVVNDRLEDAVEQVVRILEGAAQSKG